MCNLSHIVWGPRWGFIDTKKRWQYETPNFTQLHIMRIRIAHDGAWPKCLYIQPHYGPPPVGCICVRHTFAASRKLIPGIIRDDSAVYANCAPRCRLAWIVEFVKPILRQYVLNDCLEMDERGFTERLLSSFPLACDVDGVDVITPWQDSDGERHAWPNGNREMIQCMDLLRRNILTCKVLSF